MRRSSRITSVFAAIGIAALLSACGGSDDETQSPPMPIVNMHGSSGPMNHAAAATGPSSKQTEAAGRKQEAGGPQGGTSASQAKGRPPEEPTNGNAGRQHGATAAKPVHIKGCPRGMSKGQCEQVGLAAQHQENSAPNVVGKDECPAAMSESECSQAGKVYEEASEGRVVQRNECPQAMTAQQCAEAGKAYEEATK